MKRSGCVVILGPTAVGKTVVSLDLAGDIFEIISADSVQVYRYLDIGSGKPERSERERVRHHLIDRVEPDVPYTVGDFCRDADAAVREIAGRGKVPMVVGGTGLYIDSFFQGLSDIPDIPIDIREILRDELRDRGVESMHGELMRVDPVFGGRISPRDAQRTLRGLEVYRGTGRPLSSYFNEKRRYGPEDALFIGLRDERDPLRERIDRRVEGMMDRGFVEEVRSLRQRGYGPALKSMKSIGYAEIHRFLDGEMELNETVERIKTVTKNYAKRQMTWFGKNKRISWFGRTEMDALRELVRQWLGGR
ncbi:MAG: tRNA (adenosine(37)-N6)-dimethylallyltransferase MiaA [Spirochaetes bacterium]|nr:tRNA (adenosine(37)-N6)-dimethylallyltransferase MiaA [Spirochaetota bacterium]